MFGLIAAGIMAATAAATAIGGAVQRGKARKRQEEREEEVSAAYDEKQGEVSQQTKDQAMEQSLALARSGGSAGSQASAMRSAQLQAPSMAGKSALLSHGIAGDYAQMKSGQAQDAFRTDAYDQSIQDQQRQRNAASAQQFAQGLGGAEMGQTLAGSDERMKRNVAPASEPEDDLTFNRKVGHTVGFPPDAPLSDAASKEEIARLKSVMQPSQLEAAKAKVPGYELEQAKKRIAAKTAATQKRELMEAQAPPQMLPAQVNRSVSPEQMAPIEDQEVLERSRNLDVYEPNGGPLGARPPESHWVRKRQDIEAHNKIQRERGRPERADPTKPPEQSTLDQVTSFFSSLSDEASKKKVQSLEADIKARDSQIEALTRESAPREGIPNRPTRADMAKGGPGQYDYKKEKLRTMQPSAFRGPDRTLPGIDPSKDPMLEGRPNYRTAGGFDSRKGGYAAPYKAPPGEHLVNLTDAAAEIDAHNSLHRPPTDQTSSAAEAQSLSDWAKGAPEGAGPQETSAEEAAELSAWAKSQKGGGRGRAKPKKKPPFEVEIGEAVLEPEYEVELGEAVEEHPLAGVQTEATRPGSKKRQAAKRTMGLGKKAISGKTRELGKRALDALRFNAGLANPLFAAYDGSDSRMKTEKAYSDSRSKSSAYSDKKSKKGVFESEATEMVRNAPGYSYEYKDEFQGKPGTAPGRQYGIMAQDLEKSAAGKSLVKQDEQGMKHVDTGRLSMVNTAALNDIMGRLDDIEGGKKKKRRSRRSGA